MKEIDKLFLQREYANLVGMRLNLFTIQQQSPYRSNFRCNICGDSQKNRTKKRGYIIEKSNSLIFHCFNQCGTINFEHYLRDYHSDLYYQYRIDLLKNSRGDVFEKKDDALGRINQSLVDGDSVLGLKHAKDIKEAFLYIKKRKIPENFYGDIFYTENFLKFVNDNIGKRFSKKVENVLDPRIVIPIRDLEKNIIGVSARSLDTKNPRRYLNIKFNEDYSLLFNIEKINKRKKIYVTEGCFDAMFIDNAVAMLGTDFRSESYGLNKENLVIVLDNEPRNSQIVAKYNQYIKRGYKIVIWPEEIKEKDINEMMIKNSDMDIMKTLDSNTFCGLKATIELNSWRKQ